MTSKYRVSQLKNYRFCHTSAASAGANFASPHSHRRFNATLLISYFTSTTARSVEMVDRFKFSLASALHSIRNENVKPKAEYEAKKQIGAILKNDESTNTDEKNLTKPSPPMESFNGRRWLEGRERDLIEKRSFMGIDLLDLPEPSQKVQANSSGHFEIEQQSVAWSAMAYQLLQKASVASRRRLTSLYSTKASKDVGSLKELSQTPKSSKDQEILSHLTPEGKAKMVDVGEKAVTHREAIAEASIRVGTQILILLKENQLKKGDALTVAQIAGVMAAKRTSELIPLCHNIVLNDIQVQLHLDEANKSVRIRSVIRCDGRTGAEMEALTAVTVAALTVYDMCKAVSKEMIIENVRLVKKTGGKSDYKADSALIEE